MNSLRIIWTSIRRNPVINAFLIAVATQIAHDVIANEVDWTNVAGYLAMVAIAVATREFTSPAKEKQALSDSYRAALQKIYKDSDIAKQNRSSS